MSLLGNKPGACSGHSSQTRGLSLFGDQMPLSDRNHGLRVAGALFGLTDLTRIKHWVIQKKGSTMTANV